MGQTKFYVYLFIIQQFVLPSYSQSHFTSGLNSAIGFPQDHFKKSIESKCYGLDGHFACHILQIPLAVGVSGSLLIYGKERDEPIYAWADGGGYLEVDDGIDIVTINSIFMSHLFLRLQPNSGRLRPYIDGLVGFSWYRTHSDIYDEWTGEAFRENHLLDRSLSYGLGCGIQYCIKSQAVYYFQDRQIQVGIYLNLGLRCLTGGVSKYMKKGVDDVYESDTDMFTARVGLTFIH